MTTDQLLDQVAQRGLLTNEQLTRVRSSVARSASPVSTKALAKYLVDKGMLTPAQAQSLLAAPQPAPHAEPAAKPGPSSDDLGLAPLEKLQLLDESSLLDVAQQQQQLAEVKKPAASKPAAGSPPAPETSLFDELGDLAPTGLLGGGPLDLLAANPAMTAGGGALLAPSKANRFRLFGPREPKKFKSGESEWESPLMLFGGGALLLLMIIGGGAFFLYLRGSGDQQFKAAEEDYQAGSYTQAIAKYTTYINKNPKHPSISLAKVHRGLARLRQATQAKDFSHALQEALAVAAEIQSEKEFPEARLEFRSIFPDIAEGLAKDAVKQKDNAAVKARLAEAEAAVKDLVMNVNYIPQSQRPMQRIAAIREIMAVANRELDREAALTRTLAAMKTVTGKSEIAAAYAARKQLLKVYPDLTPNEALAAAVLAVAESEKGVVEVTTGGNPAQTEDPASPVVAQIALAARSAPESALSGPPTALLLRGAVYGFDSGNGKLLWRRYVGLDAPTPPLSVGSPEEASLLVVDAARGELVLLAAANGKLVWRQPIGERIAGVTVSGEQAVVSTYTGKLLHLDLKKGAVGRSVTLPQGLRIAAAASSTAGRVYQVGDQSTVYVLGGDLSCQQAYYLGHETGTVSAPPLVLHQHLVVVENRGSKSCALHVLALANDGKIARAVQKIDLPGHVLTAPVVSDRKLVVMTDGGHIKVMGVNASNVEQPLGDLADQPAASGETQMLRHLLIEGGNLWIADKHLMRYKVQSSAGRLLPSPLKDDYENASFAQPLVVFGKTLIHARQPAGSSAVLVAGTSLVDGRTLWETQVATPPAGEPIADGDLVVATASGQLFSLGADALKSPVVDQPVSKEFDTRHPIVLSTRTDLKDGSVVFAPLGGDTRMLLVAASPRAGRLLSVPDPLACPPAALGKGLIVPTRIGQVSWLNPATGQPVATPFQPPLLVDSNVRWTIPSATTDGKEFVISDGPRVYRVALVREPVPHLEAAATSEELAAPIVTAIATFDSLALAADAAGRLRVFRLPDLAIDQSIELGGGVTWGPRRIGKVALLATSNDELICLSSDAKIAWRQSLKQGPLAGTPAVSGEELILSTLGGHVVRLALADGNTLGIAELGQPLATGPVALDKQWMVATQDGTLLVIASPSQEAPQ